MDRSNIKAWQVCAEDTVAAETAEQAIAWHMQEMGSDRDDLYEEAEERELTDTMLADESSDRRITMAEAIAQENNFPCLLCTTEW